MAEEDRGKPAEHPAHPHEGGPPGQNPDFVPPGHGGTPPGQVDKPDEETEDETEEETDEDAQGA